jgi:hypothetical protein
METLLLIICCMKPVLEGELELYEIKGQFVDYAI